MLRQTLDAGKAAFWTLDDEINLLLQYIKLEQLRFHFGLTIETDERIVEVNHSFPAMLLQPVVENAIKHGVSSRSDGHLYIGLRRENDNLLVTVKDNGPGFTFDTVQEGDGLRLTRERIDFINRQAEYHIRMDIPASVEGTTIIFTCKDYFQDNESHT